MEDSTLALLVFVVTVIGVAGTFYYGWHSKRKKPEVSQATTTNTSTTQSADHSHGNVQVGTAHGPVTVSQSSGISGDVTELVKMLLEHNANNPIGEKVDAQGEMIKQLLEAVQSLMDMQEQQAKSPAPTQPEGIDEALACLENGDTRKAEAIFQTILDTKEAEGHMSLKEAAQAAKHIGALAFLHDTQKALAAYKKATELSPDDAEAWNELGILLMRTGDLSIAERAFNTVLALGNATADQAAIAVATGNLGAIAKTRGELDRAEDYHQQAHAIDTELGSKEGMAANLGNLGLIARTRGQLDQAEDYHQQSLAIETELGHKEGIASDLGNLGLIAQTRGQLDLAEDYHQQALAINTELGSKEGMANQLGNLGLVAALRGDRIEACRLWREAMTLFQALGMTPQIDITQGLLNKLDCDGAASGIAD